MQNRTSDRNETGHVTLTPAAATELREHMLEVGDRAAIQRFGLTRFSLARAAARLPVQFATAEVIYARLGASPPR